MLKLLNIHHIIGIGKDSEVDEFSRVLIDNIFSQLDRLGVDYRRLVFEDFDHIVTIAGDF